jgi:hypothetical protein
MSKKRDEFVIKEQSDGEVVVRRRRKGSNQGDALGGCSLFLAVLFAVIGYVGQWISML